MSIIKNALEGLCSHLQENIYSHKSLSKERELMIAEYGDSYKNTLSFTIKELQIAVIGFKTALLETIVKALI